MEDVQIFKLQQQGGTKKVILYLCIAPKQTQITDNFFNGLKKKTKFLILLLSQENQ